MTLPSQPRALREPSKQFSRQCRIGLFVPYISSVVLQEIARASARDADQMVVEINRLAPVELTPERGSRATGCGICQSWHCSLQETRRCQARCPGDSQQHGNSGKLESSASGQ